MAYSWTMLHFMAVPKKRTSPSRKGLRRAGHTHKIAVSTTMTCPNCQAETVRHKACPTCGHYQGRQVFTIKVKKDKSQEGEKASN